MRHYIIVTHAYLSKGFKSSIEMIIGKQENVSYYFAYVEENINFVNEIKEEISKFNINDEVLILTDMFGGSVNNEMMELIKVLNVHLITGINLILIISLLLDSSDLSIGEMIQKNINEAKQGMIYCNNLNRDEENASLDEF
ncbi:MAG: PTS fructose transporter subunit IIA [Erysipelotrichaceae bacterium]